MNYSSGFIQPYMVDVYSGESFSSWICRINVEVDSELSTGTFKLEGLLSDPDVSHGNQEFSHFITKNNVSDKFVAEKFKIEFSEMSPIRYRRSYCYECLRQALVDVKGFVSMIAWRSPLKPFCEVHRALLIDAPKDMGPCRDQALRVFKWHHSKASASKRYEKLVEFHSRLFDLGLRVQLRFFELRNERLSERFELERFMLTLMRAMLMPSMSRYYRGIDFNADANMPTLYSRDSFYSRFYFEVHRASSEARARAYFLCGILLGWITPYEAAHAAKDNDYYLATDAATIWSGLDKSLGLKKWMLKELARCESAGLSINSITANLEIGSA